MDAIQDWQKCIIKAKRKLGVSDKFVLIKGRLLREVQKAYCAMGY
jgi:hypothetical protein